LQCALCHTVQGTGASGTLGPNLTHLASRRTLGAGTFPNTRGHLAGWVVDPQTLKPGVRMPPTVLGGEDLQALLDYLGGLK
jgi:cytochrome c oxidase subunit II